MSPQLVALLAAIFASHARVEGMKAENQQRAAQGDSPAYREDVFNNEASYLDALAVDARNCTS